MAKVYAHRGASKAAPENTMASFAKAHTLGAHGIELDVHVLPDGAVVVHHDDKLGRCESKSGSIYSLRENTVKSFSAGEWFSADCKNETIPFFEEVLVYLKETDLLLNCEIKQQIGFVYPYEEKVLSLINHYGMAQKTIISSFNHGILKNIKKQFKDFKVGALCSSTYGIDTINYCIKNEFDAIHPKYSLVDKDFVKRAHEGNLKVNVWTVDNIDDILKMCDCGVDTIITNDVEACLAEVQKYQSFK